MTDKQRNYFNSILAGVKFLTEEQKAAFTEIVENHKDSKAICIDCAKYLDDFMRRGEKRAVRIAKEAEEKGYKDGFKHMNLVWRFINSISEDLLRQHEERLAD